MGYWKYDTKMRKAVQLRCPNVVSVTGLVYWSECWTSYEATKYWSSRNEVFRGLKGATLKDSEVVIQGT